MSESGKRKYIAKKGISFDGLKGKPRVEAGGLIPEGVPEATIKDLLHDGVIEEVKPKQPKVEAKK